MTDNNAKMAAQERESQNQPIQGTIGDALNLALYNLVTYRHTTGMKYKIILPVHDAIFLDTPADEVTEVADKVLPYCMSDSILIPNTQLHLGVDVEISRRWGEHITKERALEEAYAEIKIA